MKKSKIISFIFCFSSILVGILSTIDYWCFNNSFYKNEYSKLNTAESIGISNDDLGNATDTLLDYLKDKRDGLIVEANVNGKIREVFNERETLHMVDVKDLYQNVLLIRNIFIAISIICLIYIVFSKDNKYLYIEYKKALLVFGFIFLLIGIACLIDFNSFWVGFHHVFFPNNDLWLLNPNTDILIMMVPEQFFFDLCISIVISVFVLIFGFMFILKYVDRKFINEVN